jgi:hypothetical protein
MSITAEIKQRWRFVLLVQAALTLAGCGLAPKALTGPPDPGEQCASLLDEAFPGGDIAITAKKIVPNSITTTTITIDGTRDIEPSAALARDVAVECRFERGVLLDFHWTKPPFR